MNHITQNGNTDTISVQQTIEEIVTRIYTLKKQKNVVVLAHYYMPPELQLLEKEGGIADFLGDSLGLSLEAKTTTAEHILFCGVRFMAETALVLNPHKKVFMPDVNAGCSLAESISANDIKSLKQQYPGIPVMAYINTNAEAKTEADICCTSRNAVSIARSFDNDTLIFVPDKFMGQNLAANIEKESGKKLILWNGSCEVHERFKKEALQNLNDQYKDAEVLMHWEVPGDTVAESMEHHRGVLGSTNDIVKHVAGSKARQFILASECDLSVTLKRMYSDREFITPCFKCPYMKMNTLENTLQALEAIGTEAEEIYRINLSEDILKRAYLPVERMLSFN